MPHPPRNHVAAILSTLQRGVGLAAVVAAVFAALPSSAQGPVAYFPFNGSTDDASGHGNHATVLGAVPTADRFGNPDSAYLVGSHGHLEAADSDSLDITEAFTLSLWFRQDDMISVWAVLAGKSMGTAYSVSVYSDVSFACPDPTAERAIHVTVGGASVRFAGGPFFDCGIGEWHHIAVTVGPGTGPDNLTRLWADGVYIGETGLAGEMTNNTVPLGIGKDGETSDRFAGAIDDLRLYDRELGADEIVELFNSVLIDGFESGSISTWSTAVGG